MKSSLQKGKTKAGCSISHWKMLLCDTHSPTGKASEKWHTHISFSYVWDTKKWISLCNKDAEQCTEHFDILNLSYLISRVINR